MEAVVAAEQAGRHQQEPPAARSVNGLADTMSNAGSPDGLCGERKERTMIDKLLDATAFGFAMLLWWLSDGELE